MKRCLLLPLNYFTSESFMVEKSENIKPLLKLLGFQPEENSQGIYYKKYSSHKNYIIKINLDKEEIDYGTKITLGDKTTSNFKASENFVVLECVNRLLEKGYSPENLKLEKDYPLGHKTKGKLDILVTDKDGKTYLMIECKTWGVEYDKATKKTLNDGGQLLSYFQQDKSSKFLCLYASKIENNTIAYKNGIIKVEEGFLHATNTQEVFEKWNKNLKLNGIFEEGIEKYHITPKAYILNQLYDITYEISSIIFNQFEEILRRNVISDKPNAFNKFIALFICKIVDEKKKKTEQLEFQWLDDDTPEKLLIRLNDLYRSGMKSYLDKTITDYSDKDVDDEFNYLDASVRGNIKKMFARMRLEKNNEFAFKEVFDNQTFLENAKVVKEMVQMLEKYRVRYNRKHDYLGAFFELLLNTSLKQEAGQFFTPVPVARFIINSIPLKEMVLHKIKDRRDEDILPYAIDYACGSGHFITELMDQMQIIINEIATKDDYDAETERTLKSWTLDQFKWAEKYIYGIEKDYRLFKTAKVACFLNGDGLANIVNADGLAAFNHDEGYRDKLIISAKNNPKDNEQFEVLVSNPPYSVSAFRNTIEKSGATSFELYNRLTSQSSEIESLFIERSKQLLKEGGCAGIVLPSSILSNTGIYSDARDILLKYFKIIAITEFGSNTFMATGTNTVVLFLQRRNNYDYQRIEKSIDVFFQTQKDNTANGIENIFSKYVAHVYKIISLGDYLSLVNKKPNEKMKENELFKDYHKDFFNSTFVKNQIKKPEFKSKSEAEKQSELDRMFYSDVLVKEKEKLLFFILAYPQKTLLIKANPDGKNETEKEFLGYEFSNRRGHEGIKPYGAKTIPETTKMYDETNLLNPEKANTYIYNAFLGNEITISENMQKHINQQNLVDMINFDRVVFEKSISLSVKKKAIDYFEIWGTNNLISLNEIALILKGKSITKTETKQGKIPVIAGGKEPAYFHNQANRKGDVITISASGANAGFVNFFTQDIFASDCNTIQSKDENIISTKLLYCYLTNIQQLIYKLQRGQAQPHVYAGDLENIKVPLPPKNIQEKIVKEIEAIEKKEKDGNEKINKLKVEITEKSALAFKKYKEQKIEHIALMLRRGKSTSYGNSKIQIIKSGQARGYTSFDFSTKFFVQDDFVSDERNLLKGDILINSTGVGTAGRVTLFELYGDFVVDSHVTIVRLNKEKALPKFVLYSLAHIGFKNIEKMAVGQSGQIELSLSIINNIKIPLPSITEQSKIVSEIEKIEIKIAEFTKQLANIASEKNAILKKYL